MHKSSILLDSREQLPAEGNTGQPRDLKEDGMGFPCWEQLVKHPGDVLWEGKLLRVSLWQRQLRMGRDEKQT